MSTPLSRSLHMCASVQWESHLWGQISGLKEQVGGLIDRWTVEEQQQREQLKHTTEQVNTRRFVTHA